MAAYIWTDDYVDLSDIYVILLDLYVDFSEKNNIDWKLNIWFGM